MIFRSDFMRPPSIVDIPLASIWLTLTVCLAGAVMMAMYIFAVVAVVRMRTHGTKGWNVAGNIGGWLLGAIWLLVIGSAVVGVGVLSLRAARLARMKSAGPFVAPVRPQTVEGRLKRYKIDLPASWTLSGPDATFDLRAHDFSGLSIAVLVQRATGSTIEEVEARRDRIKKNAAEFTLGNLSTVQIDGHAFLEFSSQVRLHADSNTYAYHYYEYSGPEGTFQIKGWRKDGFRDDDVSSLRSVAMTFRFPARSF